LKKILFVFSLLLLHASFADAKFDPSFVWNTLETTHFSIQYHQGEEEIAKRVAVLAEDVHDRLVPRIKWEPKGRTHLVLVDAVDASNGLTTPFPYNLITLYITPPVGEPGFGTVAYDEWMRLLITHEYTHTLQLDMVYGGYGAVMRALFGRSFLGFPNLVQPIWLIEGLAVYEETEQTSGGRNRSPGHEMVIRTAVLEDRFPRMSQATVFPDFWPTGQVPYLFGGAFNRFIAEKYGREKLAEISVTYSSRGVPFLVDSTGERVLQQEYGSLWDEWLNGLRTRYAVVRDEVIAKGLTTSLALTKRGFLNSFPAFSPDGARIAYVVENNDEFPGIYVMNSDGTGDRKLVENTTSGTSSGGSIAWSPDGNRIYYTKFEIRGNYNLYNDIYYYDFKKEEEVQVTRELRARDPSPSPDNKGLVFVTSKLGKTRLASMVLPADLRGPLREKDVTWLSDENENQYETPRYSPDGTMIVVGVRQPGGFKDIWILDSRGSRIEELMHDRAIDGGAAWSADGKVIYFASDRTGIFNLYAYELATKKTSQVTNVLGGAFTPAPSPDGKILVFSSYSSKGFDLHLRPAESASWKPAEPYLDTYPTVTYADKPVATTARSYNPLPTLLPRFWLPWYGFSDESRDLFGFLTFGSDAVERHTYFLSGLYSPQTHRKWYSVNYAYDGFYPTLNLAASDTDVTFTDLLTDPTGTRNYVQQEKTIDASLAFPLLKIRKQHVLAVGYRRTDASPLTSITSTYAGVVPAKGLLVSGRTSYLYNNADQFGNSISPEDGRTIELGYERLDKSLQSDFNVTKYTADWHEYIDFPWKHHVLLARGFAGASSGDVLPQRAFQLGGDNPGDITIPVTDDSVFLRGYPANEFRGRNAALASLEYRFPITDIEVGISNKPIFFRRVHGAFFVEGGNAWDNGFHLKDSKYAVGTEGRLDLYVIYNVPITFRLGLAKALDQPRDLMLIFNLWTPAFL
jgi:Tol biopolymer transport system component